MKLVVILVATLLLSSSAYSQSGRRPKEVRVPVPLPEQEVNEPQLKRPADEPPPVTAERDHAYHCTDDGSLALILETEAIGEPVFTAKELDSRAQIIAKPKPGYTKEARRNGVQGFVTLKLLLSGRGTIARVRVLKRLPAGLTENAIRAACKLQFKPAIKNGRPVAQWVTADYLFRLADSSIFGP
jgi:TonB family protein